MVTAPGFPVEQRRPVRQEGDLSACPVSGEEHGNSAIFPPVPGILNEKQNQFIIDVQQGPVNPDMCGG